MAGKLPAQPPIVARVAGQSSSRLLYVTDSKSRSRYLADTGAPVSCIPPTADDKRHYTESEDIELAAANGTPIKVYGTRVRTINIGKKKFKWTFIIADVKQNIIGCDFLGAHGLVVDVQRGCLLHTSSFKTIPLKIDTCDSHYVRAILQDSCPYTSLLAKYPDLVTLTFTFTNYPHFVISSLVRNF